MAVTLPILGLSRWNKNWNVRNSNSDVATATKIRFQFPRSPDAQFGGLIGWLFNWKLRKFSCWIISNIANYLKYNYFSDGDGIDNATLRLWKFSDFCSRRTVGIAGDDIMFHILVVSYVSPFPRCNICLIHTKRCKPFFLTKTHNHIEQSQHTLNRYVYMRFAAVKYVPYAFLMRGMHILLAQQWIMMECKSRRYFYDCCYHICQWINYKREFCMGMFYS